MILSSFSAVTSNSWLFRMQSMSKMEPGMIANSSFGACTSMGYRFVAVYVTWKSNLDFVAAWTCVWLPQLNWPTDAHKVESTCDECIDDSCWTVQRSFQLTWGKNFLNDQQQGASLNTTGSSDLLRQHECSLIYLKSLHLGLGLAFQQSEIAHESLTSTVWVAYGRDYLVGRCHTSRSSHVTKTFGRPTSW